MLDSVEAKTSSKGISRHLEVKSIRIEILYFYMTKLNSLRRLVIESKSGVL